MFNLEQAEMYNYSWASYAYSVTVVEDFNIAQLKYLWKTCYKQEIYIFNSLINWQLNLLVKYIKDT